MDNLFCANLFPPPFSGGQVGQGYVQRRSAPRQRPVENIPGQRDQHSGRSRKLIGISPES
jgi:hypothetical protein